MSRVKLKPPATNTVKLDGSGNGTTKVGPISGREIWYPSNVHVSVNPGQVTNEAQCLIYVGTGVGSNTFRDGTLSGSSGDSSDAVNADEIKVGEYVWAVWIGGDSGQIATLVVTGDKEI